MPAPETPSTSPTDDDVEGHKYALSPDDNQDDVEGHKAGAPSSSPTDDDVDDVEGHKT